MKTRNCLSAFSLPLTPVSLVVWGRELKQKLLFWQSLLQPVCFCNLIPGERGKWDEKGSCQGFMQKELAQNLESGRDSDPSSAVVSSENWCLRMRTGALRATAVLGKVLVPSAQNVPTQSGQGRILSSKEAALAAAVRDFNLMCCFARIFFEVFLPFDFCTLSTLLQVHMHGVLFISFPATKLPSSKAWIATYLSQNILERVFHWIFWSHCQPVSAVLCATCLEDRIFPSVLQNNFLFSGYLPPFQILKP